MVAVGFGVPWCDRASQADGAHVVVAVTVGKALCKQLSVLLAGRRAGAALPEQRAEKQICPFVFTVVVLPLLWAWLSDLPALLVVSEC